MNSQSDVPTLPKLLPTIKAGFDSVGAHVELVIFPILLDILIWFGPHISLRGWLEPYRNSFMQWFRGSLYSYDTIQTSQEMWQMITERLNLLTALRAYPVGIPSLMASRMPITNPIGAPVSWGVTSFLGVAALWLVLTLVGLVLGTLYYSLVAQSALEEQVNWRKALADWPREASQVLQISLALLIFVLIISFPASCLLSLSALAGLTASQCALMLYGGFLLWALFPWVFSAHGVFVHQDPALKSIQRGARLSRMTVFSTSFLIMVIILLTQGLDFLWNATAENSWLSLIGITGHAIVTTGLLAASLRYYRDADQWVQWLVSRQAASATEATRE